MHAIDPAEVPSAAPADPLSAWDKYLALDDRSATFDRAHGWLLAHRPPLATDALVHGDLRMGNLIVGPVVSTVGITAVLLFGAGVALALAWYADVRARGDRTDELGSVLAP